MTATRRDITMEAYATFRLDLYCKDSGGAASDLTNYTGVATVRKNYSDNDALATFTVTITGATGLVSLTMPKSETLKLQDTLAGVWDVFLTAPDATVIKLMYGKVVIIQAASRL